MCSTSFSWEGTADQRTHCALETTLISLSSYFSFKLYLVGGSVRRAVDDGRRTPTGRQSPLEIWKTNLKSFILLTKQPSKTVLYHLNFWRCVILDPMTQWRAWYSSMICWQYQRFVVHIQFRYNFMFGSSRHVGSVLFVFQTSLWHGLLWSCSRGMRGPIKGNLSADLGLATGPEHFPRLLCPPPPTILI